jgi:two-component SAPR family response regulator
VRVTEREGASEERIRHPDLTLVVGDLGDLHDDDTTLELIGTDGPRQGIQMLAATTHPEVLGPEVLAHFDTRLVLQTLDEQQSVQVLGRSDAAHLGSGELLVRLAGRTPIRARGLRLDVDHLEQLVRLMVEVYGNRSGRGPVIGATGGVAAPDTGEPGPPDEGPNPPPSEQVRQEPSEGSLPAAPEWQETSIAGETRGVPHNGPGETSAPVSVPLIGINFQEPVAASTVMGGAQLSDEGRARSAGLETGVATAVDAAPAALVAASDEAPRQEAGPGVSSSAIRVQCFGALVVRSGDREILPADDKSGRHKAWEILAFLATQPGGAAPKDKLLAALWPSAGTEQATNRMRVAMARLRTVLAQQVPGLPSEVVRAERDGTCRLDTSLVTSDAHEFGTLCQRARKLPPDEARVLYERALALYQGDLLADRAYSWIDERAETGLSPREAWREEYYQTLQQLARLHQRAGRAQMAVPLYKRLLKSEPTLEDVVRELFRCYGQLGDIGSLVREERQLRQALHQAYQDPDDNPGLYQPEPETIAVFREALADLQARADADSGSA